MMAVRRGGLNSRNGTNGHSDHQSPSGDPRAGLQPTASSSKYPYQDPALPIPDRVADLLSRMTLEEKAGQLFHDMLAPETQGSLTDDTSALLATKHMTHFNLIDPITDARATATWHNALQQHVITHTRLGIPITLSSDPRHHLGGYTDPGVLSRWPGPFGLAALRDLSLVRRFADMVRREYIAVGVRVALHPQADVATEYRWARVASTFGEAAEVVADLVVACVEGLQGPGEIDGQSVATVTKHFPGAGPEMDGEDSHFVYGKEQIYPGDRFEYHLEPFRRAIEAGTRHIMPSYAMPVRTQYEQVGFAFNKEIITDLLREKLGFNGIIVTDWGLITDGLVAEQFLPARAWGCEHLTELERLVKILDAGCDQFGGEARPELVVQAVQKDLISESRVDDSVRRVLAEKFTLGLFDDKRFVDVDNAGDDVGSPAFVALGARVQRESYTILTNLGAVLPISLSNRSRNIYAEGVDAETLASRGLTVVSDPAQADIALLRLQAPYEPRPGGFERHFHAGSLEFPATESARITKIIETVPTSVVDVYLDRPAVLTPLVEAQVGALVVNYGSDDDAFLDVCFGVGEAVPRGKLPFDLPRSMRAVESSREDVPFDTENPLFRFGHGLTLRARK